MNQMNQALHELSEMDGLAARHSFIHDRNAGVKLSATVLYILIVVSFSKYEAGRLLPMILWPVLLFQISGIPLGTCFYKLRIVLPLVLAVGLFNPLFDRNIIMRIGGIGISGGVLSMITLMMKGVFCLMASFLLVATTSIDRICAALRRIHVPAILTTLLLLTYRYVGVMVEEVAIMMDAYSLRAPGQKGIAMKAWGSFLGQVLLRSMDRAQELYGSMQLRGYQDRFYYVEQKSADVRDVCFLALSLLFFLIVRLFGVTDLLGGLFV